jgi:hypothetical protein
VLSRGAEVARPIRIAGCSWHAHNGSTSSAAGVRRRFGLETKSTALAGNGGHSSDHRSISPERAAPYPSICVATGSRRDDVRWRRSVPGDFRQDLLPEGGQGVVASSL